jgi:type VI secretion system secreted protein Hcp
MSSADSFFLKIEGIVGESQDANHVDWIDVLDVDWGASQPGNMTTGGGGGIGKANFNDMHVVARLDKAAATVLKYCASGKHIGTVEVSMCKAGGEQMEHTKFTLNEVLVTSVRYSCHKETGQLVANYSFQSAKVKQQYWPQTAQGQKGPEVQVAWDIKANKEA